MNPLKETKTMSKPNSIQTSIVKSEHVPITSPKVNTWDIQGSRTVNHTA